jgi:CBS domain-containing protein
MSQRIADLMTRDVSFAWPHMTIREAAVQMKERDIGSLPVCEGLRVVGILTDRDLALRATAEGRDPDLAKVGDVMTREIISCRPEDSLEQAEQLMHDWQLRRLPVVDDKGELLGLLTLARVARAETAERAGHVIKGVSQPSQPFPLDPLPNQATENERVPEHTRGLPQLPII